MQKKWILLVKIILIFVLGFCFCYFFLTNILTKNNHQTKQSQIIVAKKYLQHGDIIFRRGADAISDLFISMNQRNKSYSHCGIYLCNNNIGYVYHSIGGEDNPTAVIRNDSFENFVSSKNNLSYGIYRLAFTPKELIDLDSIVNKWYRDKYTFDMDFSLTNNEKKMYCVEFVVKAIEAVKQDSTYFTRSNIVVKNFKYVAPDDVMLNKNAALIFAEHFR
jgi:Permuted papain-like amidase enzyme, YaeF/YiiX, C92 family